MNDNHLFWAKVQRGDPEECWPWLGYKKPSGHGLTTYQCFSIHASRKAWILTHGPIRDDGCVNHLCENAACCNPAHMYIGSRASNMVDRFRKADKRIPHDRTTVLSVEDLERYHQMREEGLTVVECAAKLGVHHMTIYRKITAVRLEKLRKLRAAKLVSRAQ